MERTDFEMTEGSVEEPACCRTPHVKVRGVVLHAFGTPGHFVSIAGDMKEIHQDPIHRNMSHNRKPVLTGREASSMPRKGKRKREY